MEAPNGGVDRSMTGYSTLPQFTSVTFDGYACSQDQRKIYYAGSPSEQLWSITSDGTPNGKPFTRVSTPEPAIVTIEYVSEPAE